MRSLALACTCMYAAREYVAYNYVLSMNMFVLPVSLLLCYMHRGYTINFTGREKAISIVGSAVVVI